MNTATPTSLPEPVSSSAGMRVSTAAEMNAASVALRVSQTCGSDAAAAAVATSGLHAVNPVAIAAPAAPAAPAPFRRLRRAIFTAAMYASPTAAATDGCPDCRLKDPMLARHARNHYVYTCVYIHWDLMATARVFKSGNSQAVRLPKEFRLKGPEVEI